ncbi:MAG: 2-oxoglutarate oxidoreductase [Oscillospiraceae bacterium]|nr:2-oxoglutarate oxidoreductase [Oscillospiraceae bacterium]
MSTLYKRPTSILPNASSYCPGCMHATATRIIAEVVDDLGVKDNAIYVLPVGCSTQGITAWDMDIIGAAHGRAPAVATGIKRCRPDCLVFCYQGDGDLASIGLSEIMSAANRGENITVIYANNSIFGMTGGQMAPTTLIGQKATTAVEGRQLLGTGWPLKMCELIAQLEAPRLVMRCTLRTPAGIRQAKAGILKGFKNQLEGKGFSFIELLTNCPTTWHMTPLESLDFMEKQTEKYFPCRVFADREERFGE